MRLASPLGSAALLSLLAIATPAIAQQQGPGGEAPSTQQAGEEQAIPAPLSVGSMAIASDAALSIEAMAVDASIDRVSYVYKLKNSGSSKLSLAASVALPDLEVNTDGSTVYILPTDTAENVVGLEVKSNGQPVATTPNVQATALGVDRRAELAGAGIPLIPFGESTEKALAGAKPETIAKLQTLGLVIPRDPSQPNAAVIGDWSLRVVHSWPQNLDPGVSTEVNVGFSPIKAVYTIDASNVAGFDAMKEAACLTPQFMSSVKALFTAKDSTVDVADILIANDGPARWLQNPPARIAVHKPTPGSLVSFCGLNPNTRGAATVTGTMPNSSESAGLRVLIFARSDGR